MAAEKVDREVSNLNSSFSQEDKTILNQSFTLGK